MVGYKLSKNDWVTPFFVIFRSVREILLVTVFCKHPVVHQDAWLSDANILSPIKELLNFRHGQIPSKTVTRSATDGLPCHWPFAKLPAGKHNIESLVKVL